MGPSPATQGTEWAAPTPAASSWHRLALPCTHTRSCGSQPGAGAHLPGPLQQHQGRGSPWGGSRTVPWGRRLVLPTAAGWGSPPSAPLPALGLARAGTAHGSPPPAVLLWGASPFPTLTAAWSLAAQSLCQILEASVNIGSRSLDVQLDALLGTLHPQVGVPWGRWVGREAPGAGQCWPCARARGARLTRLWSCSRLPLPLPRAGAGVAGSLRAGAFAALVSHEPQREAGCSALAARSRRRGKTNISGPADLSNSSLWVNKPGAGWLWGSTRGPLLGLLSPGSSAALVLQGREVCRITRLLESHFQGLKQS